MKSFAVHPALLDTATGLGLLLAPGYATVDAFFVPLSYDRLRFFSRTPTRIVSHVRLRPETRSEFVAVDVDLFDESGMQIAEIRNFAMKRVSPSVLALGASDADPAQQADSTGLDFDLTQGLSTQEGLGILDDIMSRTTPPQIVVSTIDLDPWLMEIDSRYADQVLEVDGAGAASDSGQPRPELSTPFVAPRSDMEITIAGVLQSVLGVCELGVFDNFYELGGHSLLLTQVVSRLRKVTGVPVSLESVFADPTVSGIADSLQADEDAPEDALPELRAVDRSNYRIKVDDN